MTLKNPKRRHKSFISFIFYFSFIENIIYAYPSQFMLSCCGRYLYFNDEKNQISYINIINAAFGSSG